MAIKELTEDLKKISGLGDNPNADNNMTAEDLKAMFDAASLIIQAYINGTIVPAVNDNTDKISGKVSKAGDSMEGSLDMAGNVLCGLADPTADDHAARKAYVDTIIRNVVGFTGAHNDLTGRDATDQHPISAIIGLASALAKTDVDAGSESLPVYFKNGVPKVCGAVAKATQIATARKMKINLASGTAAEFDGTQDINPGVEGVLSVANGGTGQSTGAAALTALLASGNIILTSKHYGTSLPTAGTKGRLFFKVVG